MTGVTDDNIRILLGSVRQDACEGIRESLDSWGLGGSLRINKRFPRFSDGFGYDLHPQSHYYKRWFDFPDTNQRGWAIIFQVAPLTEKWARKAEYFAGWVPPEREQEADRWIDFLNGEIKARLEGR